MLIGAQVLYELVIKVRVYEHAYVCSVSNSVSRNQTRCAWQYVVCVRVVWHRSMHACVMHVQMSAVS